MQSQLDESQLVVINLCSDGFIAKYSHFISVTPFNSANPRKMEYASKSIPFPSFKRKQRVVKVVNRAFISVALIPPAANDF